MRLFLFFISEIFFINERNSKPLGKHVFDTVLVFLQIVLKVRAKSQIPKIFIPIIIIIMVNLSLINNNKVMKSLELTSNSKHRTSSKYGEHRKRKN